MSEGMEVGQRQWMSLLDVALEQEQIERVRGWQAHTHPDHQHEVWTQVMGSDSFGGVVTTLVGLMWDLDSSLETVARHLRRVYSLWEEVTESRIDGCVYLLYCEEFDAYKLGRSREPLQRHKTLQIQLPYPVRLIHVARSEDYRRTETELHEAFADQRLNGEWFKLDTSDVGFVCDQTVYRYPDIFSSESDRLGTHRELVAAGLIGGQS